MRRHLILVVRALKAKNGQEPRIPFWYCPLFTLFAPLLPSKRVLAKFDSFWLLVQGFHRLLGGLQFTLAIVKLRSTVLLANCQRGSSGHLATQTLIVHGPN